MGKEQGALAFVKKKDFEGGVGGELAMEEEVGELRDVEAELGGELVVTLVETADDVFVGVQAEDNGKGGVSGRARTEGVGHTDNSQEVVPFLLPFATEQRVLVVVNLLLVAALFSTAAPRHPAGGARG